MCRGCVAAAFPESTPGYLLDTLPIMGRLADRTLSRRQVEGLIAEGKTIIILDNNVLRVDSWLKFHPGGDKAILHMVGRDATDEINAYVFWSHLRVNRLIFALN